MIQKRIDEGISDYNSNMGKLICQMLPMKFHNCGHSITQRFFHTSTFQGTHIPWADIEVLMGTENLPSSCKSESVIIKAV